jgi:flagellar motor switch protein FliM
MAQKKIRPFDFSRIKKLSRQYVNLSTALLEVYPSLEEPEALGRSLIKDLAGELHLSISLQYVGMEEMSQSQLASSAASPCVGVIFQAEPQGHRCVVDMDYPLARMLVDKLLGGDGEPPKERLPLSSGEEAVLEFLWAKVLSHLKAGSGLMGPSTFRLQKIVSDPKQLLGPEGPEALGCVFKFFLGLKKNGGYLRVYFPHPSLEGCLLREDALAGALPQGVSWERRVGRASHVRTSLVSEVGRVQLTPADQAQLEEGDVILFDESLAAMGPRGVHGKTVLRVGDNTAEGLLGELIDTEGKVVVKVLDFYGGSS